GIRDLHVTGVQTCALPISAPEDMAEHLIPRLVERRRGSGRRGTPSILLAHAPSFFVTVKVSLNIHGLHYLVQSSVFTPFHAGPEIGRASCREKGLASPIGA